MNMRNALGWLCFSIGSPAVFICNPALGRCPLLVRLGKGTSPCGQGGAGVPGLDFRPYRVHSALPQTWPELISVTVFHCNSLLTPSLLLGTGYSFFSPMGRIWNIWVTSDEHKTSEEPAALFSRSWFQLGASEGGSSV